jgi:hypothetical protein
MSMCFQHVLKTNAECCVKDIPITTQFGLLSAHIYNLPTATCIMHVITCQPIFVQGKTVCKNISLRYQICPLLALYEINLPANI